MDNAINYLNQNLKCDDIVVLGCSGGPDSMALLNILMDYRKHTNIFLVCAHVNHNIRVESKDELLFLKAFCEQNDVKFETMTIENYGDDNFENEARNIRYNYFEQLINKYNANCLMTAHHGDDLIETILMRIVRGSTLSGYSGFSTKIYKDNYIILRPLVYTTKDEIKEYNEKNNIPYVVDQTNFSDEHTRNRYRKYVLPFLKKEDKNVHMKFLKYSNILQLYEDFFDKQVSNIVNDIYNQGKLNITKFKELDLIIQNRIIYKMLEEFYQDDLFLITDVHVNLIKELIDSNKSNSVVYLPNDVKSVKSYNYLTIVRETELISKYDIELIDLVHLPNGKCIEKIGDSKLNTNYYCRLNFENITLPLSVRTKASGDKMIIKGMNESKKIKDIFINSKIPIKDRELWPIVCDAKGNIIWIPGLKKSKFDIPQNKKCDIIFKYY